MKMIENVSKITGVPVKKILSKHGNENVRFAREMYWKLLNEKKGFSFWKIARLNGYGSHATIISGIRRINDLLETKDMTVTDLWNQIKEIDI